MGVVEEVSVETKARWVYEVDKNRAQNGLFPILEG